MAALTTVPAMASASTTHHEHVCAPPTRRASTGSVSLPVRRRSSASFHNAPMPVLALREGLGRISSDTALEKAVNQRGMESTEIDIEADAVTVVDSGSSQKCKSKRLDDPESGGLSSPLEWNWSRWAGEDVKSSALVPALITQALATGILDATTYADFQTFASNQTGNAILLTLAAVGTARVVLALTAVSFGGFIGFAFVFGHVGHWVGVRRRLWLLTSVLIQTLMLVLSAIFLSPHGPRSTRLGGAHEWVVLFLFAGMSGAQVAMARQSSCAELPTAPMTSTFVDFVADHYLFAAWSDPRATPRNRRVLYVVAMIGGSFVGAAMHKYSSSWAVVAVAVGIKALVLVLVSVAPAEADR